jgi:hypothetical protein
VIRWTTLKGLAAIILFLIIAVLIEYFIVLYAISIGVKENPDNSLQLTFPGTGWIMTISPLFHLVPITVIITLLFTWTYLARRIAIKPYDVRREKVGSANRGTEQEIRKFFGKIKAGLLRVKGFAYLWQKIHFARATIKSASIVLIIFATFALVTSLLAYPKLIYQTISNAYQQNPSLLNFVNGTSQAFSPLGGIFSAVNSALLSVAPGFRYVALSFGSIIAPLANLDNVGKYLVFQNVAAWVSAFIAIFYGNYRQKNYRYKVKRKS